MKRIVLSVGPVVLLTLAPLAALAQSRPASPPPAAAPAPSVGADPQVTTATYGDWVLRCIRPDEKASRVCEVLQSIQGQNQMAVAQIAFSRATPRDPFKVTVVLPPNASFPSTVRMAVDDKDNQPADLSWRRCVPAGCWADGDLRDDILKKWRAQSERERSASRAPSVRI